MIMIVARLLFYFAISPVFVNFVLPRLVGIFHYHLYERYGYIQARVCGTVVAILLWMVAVPLYRYRYAYHIEDFVSYCGLGYNCICTPL